MEWIEEHLSRIQEVLKLRTEQSALLRRDVLGTIRLKPRKGDVGRPYYLAQTTIDCIALIETPPGAEAPGGSSNSLRQWRRRESNPRPRMGQSKRLRAYCPVIFATEHGQDTADPRLATGMSRLRRGSAAARPARTVVASRSRIGRTSPETDRSRVYPYAAIAMLLLAFVKFPVGLARFRESRHAASTSPSTSKP